METILDVKNLTKIYPSFILDKVSFSIEKGLIIGFIGRNGAGKTTTLKSLINFVHPEEGNINFFGKNFNENEKEIKEKIAFITGSFDYYLNSKIKKIVDVFKTFYKAWDNEKYSYYLKLFNIDENKTVKQLSQGMRVKFSLLLGLSHNADFFILDEPTSGLDPLAREEFLEIILKLKKEGRTIFFSTHITSDLEKCADGVVYISNGKIIYSGTIDSLQEKYLISNVKERDLEKIKDQINGYCLDKNGFSVLYEKNKKLKIKGKKPTLDEIFIHLEAVHE